MAFGDKKQSKYYSIRDLFSFKYFLVIIYLISLGVFIYYFIDGYSYSTSPLTERPHLQNYRILKPGGTRGHGFGVIGSAMMLTMLTYSIRKRVGVFKNLGTIQKWLSIHIYFGIFGPLLIILHTTFKIHGIIAISFWSMIAVALSGVVGRYLYLQIPRNIKGKKLTINEIENLNKNLYENLRSQYKFSEQMISKLDQITSSINVTKGKTASLLFTIPLQDIKLRYKIRHFKREYVLTHNIPAKQVKIMMKSALEKVMLQRRIMLLNKVQQLFHYWHVIHKPFAYIMLIIMFIHIVITVLFGYRWIF